MSDPSDYADEMRKPRPLDDRSIEAFFAGNTPDDEALLGSFAQSVRAFASQAPPAPSQALASVLTDGLTMERGDLLATAASKVSGPRREASGLPKWRRPRMTVTGLLSALMTKLGLMGAAAKAGLAVALAAAGVTAAGAAGALPGPVQNAVATAVNDVTPFTFPTQASSHAAFGAKTSTTAVNDHGVSGSSVSGAAKSKDANSGSGASSNASNGSSSANASSGASNNASNSSASNGTGGAPTNPGSQSSGGLSQANSTPAAGHAPTSVPTPTNPGSQSQSQPGGTPTNPGSQSSGGLSQANSTPAAGHAPTSVPAPTNPGSQSGSTSGAQSGSTAGSTHH